MSDLKASEEAFMDSLRQEVKLRLLDIPRDIRKQPLISFLRTPEENEDEESCGGNASQEDDPVLDRVASEVEREVSKALTTTTKKGRARAARASKTPAINVQVRQFYRVSFRYSHSTASNFAVS